MVSIVYFDIAKYLRGWKVSDFMLPKGTISLIGSVFSVRGRMLVQLDTVSWYVVDGLGNDLYGLELQRICIGRNLHNGIFFRRNLARNDSTDA